jgi:hypothetical protein
MMLARSLRPLSIHCPLVKAFIPQKDLSAKTKWFKFMHNLQSVGARKQKMSHPFNQDINIAQCPCCNNHPKTQQHMVLCDLNPNRTAALTELNSGGSTYIYIYIYIMSSLSCYRFARSCAIRKQSTRTVRHISLIS